MAPEPLPKLSAQEQYAYFKSLLENNKLDVIERLIASNPANEQLLADLVRANPQLVDLLPKDSPLRKMIEEARGEVRGPNGELQPNGSPRDNSKSSDSRNSVQSSTSANGSVNGVGADQATHFFVMVTTAVASIIPAPIRNAFNTVADAAKTSIAAVGNFVRDGLQRIRQVGGAIKARVDAGVAYVREKVNGVKKWLEEKRKWVERKIDDFNQDMSRLVSQFGGWFHPNNDVMRKEFEAQWDKAHPTAQPKPTAPTVQPKQPVKKPAANNNDPQHPRDARSHRNAGCHHLRKLHATDDIKPKTPGLPRYGTGKPDDTGSTSAPPPTPRKKKSTYASASPGMSGPGFRPADADRA